MRLEKFINEDRHTEIYFDTDNDEEKVIKMAQLLFRDCKRYLKDIGKGGDVMYRGAHGADMTKIVPRKNRQPKDMDTEMQEELDDAFDSQFGWRPRSEGVFCSGDYHQASAYGKRVFTVWPIGKYKFLYNDNVNDLYTYMDNYDDYIDTDWMYENWQDTYGEGGEGSWYYDGEDTEKSDKDDATEVVVGWLEKEHEEEEYDAYEDIDEYDWEWMSDVSEEDYIEDATDQERERLREARYEVAYDYRDDNIKNAIDSTNEIMIGCKEYYIISNNYTNQLQKILKIGKIKPVHKQLKFDFAKRKRRKRR